MKTSITAIEKASWSTPLVLRGAWEDSIKKASELGYDGIEMHLMDSDAIDQKAVIRQLKEQNICLTSIGTGPSYSQQRVFFTNEDAEKRKLALDRMKGHIHFGAETGAIVIIGLIKGQKKDCPDEKLYLDYFYDGMYQCIREAEKEDVTLCFEVIDRFESDWLNTIDEGLALLESLKSDHMKLHLDSFHMNIEEGDCAAAIRKAGDKVGHVHVADSDRWYPGHGHYDFASDFQALKDINYQGAVALESFLYPDPDTAAKLSLEYIRKLL